MPEYPLLREAGLFAALAIGIHPARAKTFRETLTASGKELIPFVRIPSFRIFSKNLPNLLVACHDLPSESPVDGLLGLDILDRLSAVLDVRKPSLSIVL